MKVILTWKDGKTTVIEEVRHFREAQSTHPQHRVEGRVCQSYINPDEVARVDVYLDGEGG